MMKVNSLYALGGLFLRVYFMGLVSNEPQEKVSHTVYIYIYIYMVLLAITAFVHSCDN